MNNPLLIISTDWHLKPSNIEEIKLLAKQEIIEASKLGISIHVWLGDIFDSRINQREEVLIALTEIIEMYDNANQTIYCIPGNHDKGNYNSSNSFLDTYKYHPSFNLIKETGWRKVSDKFLYFIPFFENERWLREYEKFDADIKETSVLFSHIAMQGSRNNDGSLVESTISPTMFENWGKVFLGHYHDYQELSDNIIHLGSITQNNFGEDENKGFWILNRDFSYDIIPSSGKKFKKLVVDLGNMTFKQADTVIKKFKESNPEDFVRVELKGNQDEVKALDKKSYQNLGIDIKVKINEVECGEVEIAEQVTALTSDDLTLKFKEFCEINNYNYEEGLSILKQTL